VTTRIQSGNHHIADVTTFILGLATAVLASALTLFAANAQDGYPSRQVTLIVPYAAGGVVDLTARLLADGLREKFNQPFVVLNKPGANGMIGLNEMVRAAPDGYTLLLNNDGGLAIPPAVDANFKWDPMKDYTPIAQVGEFTWLFLVNSSLPVTTVADFIAYSKSHPGALNYGTPGIGTLPHMATELFMRQTGVKMTHVPYKGAAPALTDLLAGTLSMNIQSVPTVIGQATSDRLKILAALSARRIKELPAVPTMEESGLKDFAISSWNGLFGPPGLPAATRDKLAQATIEVLRLPAVQEKFRAATLEPVATDAAAFSKRYYAEVSKWKAFANETGIKVTE
jgi:tripartite-type tricarboxylate transporter receptor subunit TctC